MVITNAWKENANNIFKTALAHRTRQPFRFVQIALCGVNAVADFSCLLRGAYLQQNPPTKSADFAAVLQILPPVSFVPSACIVRDEVLIHALSKDRQTLTSSSDSVSCLTRL